MAMRMTGAKSPMALSGSAAKPGCVQAAIMSVCAKPGIKSDPKDANNTVTQALATLEMRCVVCVESKVTSDKAQKILMVEASNPTS